MAGAHTQKSNRRQQQKKKNDDDDDMLIFGHLLLSNEHSLNSTEIHFKLFVFHYKFSNISFLNGCHKKLLKFSSLLLFISFFFLIICCVVFYANKIH